MDALALRGGNDAMSAEGAPPKDALQGRMGTVHCSQKQAAVALFVSYLEEKEGCVPITPEVHSSCGDVVHRTKW